MAPETVAMLIGLVATPFISWAKMENWSDVNKQRFAVLASAVCGLLYLQLGAGGSPDLNGYFVAAMLASGTNQVAFQAIMKGLGFEQLFDRLKGIQKAPPA